MDLIFPHHENEIAQSEAAHPGAGPFARLWLHNGFVNVDKEKMSKSLGNFVTVRDVLERNDPEALRCFLLGVALSRADPVRHRKARRRPRGVSRRGRGRAARRLPLLDGGAAA